jgi:CheY-like chemotaxis protein
MKKILVIDDSETNLVLLKAILEDSGFEIELANNSLEAKDLYPKIKPDLVLLDLLMPGMDGFDFLKHLNLNKEDSESLEVPIIVVTAYANDENVKKAMDLGAYDVIEKPIDISDFLFKINQVLDSKIFRK